MEFRASRGFERSLKGLPSREKLEVQRHIDAFVRALEAGAVFQGLGLKKVGRIVWEFRTSLAMRVLFQWEKGTVTFLFAGNHDEVRRFLRHLA